MNRCFYLLIVFLLMAVTPLPAFAFDFMGIFKSKPPVVEDERQATIEQIRETQDQLMLLQYKLRTLEKQKAQKEAATHQGKAPQTQYGTGESNWQEIDQSHTKPGVSGIYTYLLYSSEENDTATNRNLEELILTIEKLPVNADPPAIGNRFLRPVVPQQSMVVMARRPYDFKLASTYLERLGLSELPDGPVLVSLPEPLDPHGKEPVPPFIAVAFGDQELRRSLALTKVWHGYEKPPLPTADHPLADLFWQLVDGAGPTQVTRNGNRLLIDLTPLTPMTAASPQPQQLNR
jgi:hypothetical protein